MALPQPDPDFDRFVLGLTAVESSDLIRISRYPATEPYFSRSKGHRFDDPLQSYGVCYAGQTLAGAFAETLLHDLVPTRGAYPLDEQSLRDRHAILFAGDIIQLAELTGAHLKRIGGTNDISSELPYDTTQRWSRAVHDHPAKVGGLVYVSRHMNDQRAFALFDRARPLIDGAESIPLVDHPDLAATLDMFNVMLM